MKYRVDEIELPDADIYKNDALNRRPVVEFVEKFLTDLSGPFVLALDSPWGTGKTTVVRMLNSVLESKNVPCIYFNAWKVDYASDPLVALVSALDEIKPKDPERASRFSVQMSTVKKLTSSVARHGAVALVKGATMGILDIDPAMEKVAADMAGDVTKDLVDSFKKERAYLDKLRSALEKAVGELSRDAQTKPLIFFIDELDRCRPSFAIEMLERIKHLFDVQGLVFVLSIDKSQLEAATCAVYGDKIDADEYLRRFFDMELRVPQPDSKNFAAAQIKRFGLDDYFANRKSNHRTRDDDEGLVGAIGDMAMLFRLSLRTIERVMGRVALVCSQTPGNHFFDPVLVSFLVILRIRNAELFVDLMTGAVGCDPVVKYVRSLPGGGAFLDSHLGSVVEAYLLQGDDDQDRKISAISQLTDDANSGSVRAARMVELLKYVPPDAFYRHGFSTIYVAKKIDLAS